MEFSKFFLPNFFFNLILFISFSISVNTFVETNYINIIFYIFFHLVFIYFVFYHYHFSIFIIAFFYGVFFDILLLNNIGPHLVSFLIFILLFILLRKFLLQMNSNQISVVIFFSLFFLIIFEMLFAYFSNNILFTPRYFFEILIISIVIFVPSIFIFNKIDKY